MKKMQIKRAIMNQVHACVNYLNEYFSINVPTQPVIEFTQNPNSKVLGHFMMVYDKNTGYKIFQKSKFQFNLSLINQFNFKKYISHVIPHQVCHYVCFYLMDQKVMMKRKDQHSTQLFKSLCKAFKTREDISQKSIDI